MPVAEPLIDVSKLDFSQIVAGLDEIRQFNPQRYEMEQLTAIVHLDPVNRLAVGYKDIKPDEFWARGHMPGMPIMPGVIMLEVAAQLCSYIVGRFQLMGNCVLGFGGLDEVRFREPVCPGDRLVMVAKQVKVRPNALILSQFQGFVHNALVVEGLIKGIPLPVERTESGLKLIGSSRRAGGPTE